ncbi:MAG TPA: helicase-related protein, partial [Leptospiraceae bacterium]|nr:helicase-related protein [Leptospiraceae bacterium]
EGYLAKTEFYTLGHTGNVQLTQSEINAIQNEFDIPEKVLVQLGKNEIRNIEILKKFRDLITRHRRIMFFAASVEHSEMIAFLLRAMGIEAYSVSGKTSSSERNRVIQSFKDDSPEVKVICNFGVLTTGFDAPKTSCAFIARPTNSLVLYSQMVGRAIRGTKQKGNDKAEIITVIDTSLPGFRDMAEAFLNWEDIF